MIRENSTFQAPYFQGGLPEHGRAAQALLIRVGGQNVHSLADCVLVGTAGLEPARPKPGDFKETASRQWIVLIDDFSKLTELCMFLCMHSVVA